MHWRVASGKRGRLCLTCFHGHHRHFEFEKIVFIWAIRVWWTVYQLFSSCRRASFVFLKTSFPSYRRCCSTRFFSSLFPFASIRFVLIGFYAKQKGITLYQCAARLLNGMKEVCIAGGEFIVVDCHEYRPPIATSGTVDCPVQLCRHSDVWYCYAIMHHITNWKAN